MISRDRAAEVTLPKKIGLAFLWEVALDDLNLATGAALAVDGVAAGLGAHAGSEADLAGAFDFALLVGVMHRWGPSLLSLTHLPA